MKILWFLLLSLLLLHCKVQERQVRNEYEVGQARDGNKVGIWTYKGVDGDTELQIDYDNSTLVYLEPDTTEYLMKVDSSWVLRKPTRHPRYIGSYHEFYKILSVNLRYPSEARSNGIEKAVFLEFVVNEQGRVDSLRTINDEEQYFTPEIIRTFKLIPNVWLQAIYQGQHVPAKLLLPVYFIMDGGRDIRAESQKILDQYQGKRLEEVVIIAYTTTTYK